MIDFMYKLEEMKEEMDQALKNISEVVKQQILLNQVILDSDHRESFIKFTEDSEKQIKALTDQHIIMSKKYSLMDKLIEDLKNNESLKDPVFKLMIITGLVREEE